MNLGAGSEVFEIGAEHVTFTEKLPADVFSAPMQDAMVYVDVRLDDSLETEGYEREVIRRTQEMRKQLDLVVSESISAEVLVKNPRVYGLLCKNSATQNCRRSFSLSGRAKKSCSPFIKPGDSLRTHDLVKDWEIEGATETVSMTIGISRT